MNTSKYALLGDNITDATTINSSYSKWCFSLYWLFMTICYLYHLSIHLYLCIYIHSIYLSIHTFIYLFIYMYISYLMLSKCQHPFYLLDLLMNVAIDANGVMKMSELTTISADTVSYYLTYQQIVASFVAVASYTF